MITEMLPVFFLLCSYSAIFILGGFLGMAMGYGGGYEDCLKDSNLKKKCKDK